MMTRNCFPMAITSFIKILLYSCLKSNLRLNGTKNFDSKGGSDSQKS